MLHYWYGYTVQHKLFSKLLVDSCGWENAHNPFLLHLIMHQETIISTLKS